MKKLILPLAVCIVAVTAAHAQTNPNAELKRFVRGIPANPPVLKSFVIPLDFEKGVELDAMGDNAAKFPAGSPWFIQVPRDLRYHFGLSGNNSTLTPDYHATPFENPIVAFGSGAGGTQLFLNRTYRFGVHAGPQVQTGSWNPFALGFWITAYRKSDLQEMGTQYFVLPRRDATDPAEKARWDSYVNNGFSWPTPEYPSSPFHGLSTKIEYVEGGLDAAGWGVGSEPIFTAGQATHPGYILSHTAASDEYYFKVESLAYYPITLGGTQYYLPNAGYLSGNALTGPAFSSLYAINFDQKPTWRATDVDKPQFQGEPMPPAYLGKTRKELLDSQNSVSQTVSGSPSSYTTLDQSTELRRHPVLDNLVASLIGNLPTPEQKAIALANFVQNEIALSDPINYNESGNVSEASINPGGVSRGALATYLEGQGSPIEKAALLVYMLRQAGIPAAYMFPEKNKLKMLDIRMSSILKFQIKGAVDNLGQTEQPYDPTKPSLIPVNYPWVAANINGQWAHFFPWINDTEVVEGYNLYDYMPEGYKNAHQWIDKYLHGDTSILGLGAGMETKNPGLLFQRFIKAKLAANHPTISFDEMGIRYRDRKNYYSRLEDFPKPFELTGTPETIAALSSKADIFDTIKIKVYSIQDPAKKIETVELPIADFHNRRLLLRQSKVNATTHQFSLTLAPFRPGTSGSGAFANTLSSLALKQTVNGSANLVGTDKQLGIEISVKRNKRYFNNFTAPTDRWNSFLGYSSGSSYGTTRSINKGDLAAICLSVGKVSARMMEEHAKEFWQMESAATASPTTQDPDIYQGTATYLMGMSYYNKLDSFTEINAKLHKRLLVGNLSMGLAVLKAKYEGGVLPNGDISYVQPLVDMFYQDIGLVGNESVHADSGIENIPAKKDFEAINITAGSALEHEAIDTYFNMGDSISTVELLRTAKSNTTLYPNGFYELTVNNYMAYNATMSAYDSGLWTQVKGYFETPGSGKYAKAYITSKPVVGASGAYTGMGALVFGVNQWAALISGNLSGGAGRKFSNPASFASINVPNIRLSYNFSSAQPAYTLSTIAPSVPAPVFTNSLAPSWNYSSSVSSISSGASLVSSINTNAWASSASSLGFTPSGTGSSLSANLYSLNYATGSAGTPSFFGSVKSAVNVVSSFISDPVNLVTGEFYIDTVDLRLEGPMPLEIRRNYSSKNLAHNNFGYGWRWAYFPYLVVGQNADVIQAADADGSVIVFRKQSATEWKPIAADNPALANLHGDSFGSTANLFNSKIVLTTSGGTYYTLTGPDGSVRKFKVRSFPTGGTTSSSRERPYLEEWADSSGNYYKFEFGTVSTEPGYGEVVRVVSSNGNFIAFDYDIYGQILRAYAGDGRRVEYRYDDHGDLIEVVRPDASSYRYEYGRVSETQAGQTKLVSNHQIIRETKPEGRVLENTYDTQSRVTIQKASVGADLVPVQNASFEYSQTLDADKTLTGYTIVRDAYNRATRYEYTNSQITLERSPLNQEIRQEWYQQGDVSSGAYPRSLKKRTDKRGLITEYKYDALGNVVEKKITGDITGDGISDSAVSRASYNTLNLPTEVVDPLGNSVKTYYNDVTYPWLPTRVEKWAGGTTISRTVNEYTQVSEGSGTSLIMARGLLLRQKRAEGTADESRVEWTYNTFGFPATSTSFTGTGDPDVVTRFTYNLRGEVVEKKDALNRSVGYAYDAMGRRTWEEYRNEGGALIGWNYNYYNLNGELEWSDGPRYNPEDYVWRKYDGAGRRKEEIRWRSQASGSGVEAGSGDGLYSTTCFEHDLFGNETKIRHANGSTTSMTYDSVGRMLTRLVSGGSATASESFTYEPGDQVASHTNPLGGVTTKTYTTAGQILSQSNPDGTVLSWRYGLDGRVVRETLPGGAFWEIAYDDALRKVTRTLKSGSSTLASEEKVFDRRGNLLQQTDATGSIFTTTYDGLDRVKTTSGPNASGVQQSSTTVYDSSGKVVETTNALGEKSVVTTDIMGRTISKEIKKASNSILLTSLAYAPDHNSSTVTTGSGGEALTTKTYTDTFNNPVLVQRGNGETERSEYDSSGNLLVSYDALNRATKFTYDGLNRVLTQTIPGGAQTTFVLDAAGNVLERKMPGGLTHAATYDNAGRLLTEVLRNGSTTRAFGYSYSTAGASAGLLQTTSDPRGITFTHSYDAFRRLQSVSATGSSPAQNQARSWTYDPRGIPLTIAQTGGDQPDSLITRVPDAYGHTASESVTLGGTPLSTITQAWDAAGRRTSLNSGTGFQPVFKHNAVGQLTSASAAGLASTFSYTTAGLLTSRTNPFRTQSVTARDANGRILTQTTTAGAATPLAETMTWRANGTMNSYAALRAGTNAWNENRAYSYDTRGHVLSESYAPRPGATSTLNYTFDTEKRDIRTGAQVDAGGAEKWFVNATTVDGLARSTQFLDNTGRRTVRATGIALGAASVAITVDGQPAGNATHPGWQDTTGSWTANLRLFPGAHTLSAQATHPSGWTTPPTLSAFAVTGVPETFTQTFDAAGNVLTRTWSGGKIQTFTWDAFGQLVKVDQTGVEPSTWTACYDALGRRLQTSSAPTSTPPATPTVVRSIFDPQAEFLEIGVAVGGLQQWKVFGPDLHGGSLNGTGGLEFVITPNGNFGAISDTFGNVVASVATNNTATWSPVKVGGYGPLPGTDAKTLENGASVLEASAWRTRRIDPTGFINLGARHYDPERGIFLSCDPLGHAASVSLYDYASGDPVNAFDPDGRFGKGVGSGWSGSMSSSSPNSAAYGIGAAVGSFASGFGQGAGKGLDNFNNTATFGLYDSMGWSNSAANTGWENDLSRSFATIPRDVATGAVIGGAVNVVSRAASSVVSSLSNTATLARGASLPAASATSGSSYGVSFFDTKVAATLNTSSATLGRTGQSHFFMPIEDAATIRTAADAARQTGMAPSVVRAYTTETPVYGVSFPTAGLSTRVPTAADAGGWVHYLEGGKTAVSTGGPQGGYLLNSTREFVVPGGAAMPQGSVLFRLESSGAWTPARNW